MAFLSTPITYGFMRFCLFLEWTGLCQGSWVVALIQRKITKWKRDEVYVGTAEERAALKLQQQKDGTDPTYKQSDALDKDGDYNVHAGHLYPGVPRLPNDFVHAHLHTLDDIEELEGELNERKQEIMERLAALESEKQKILASKARVAELRAQSGDEMDA